MGQDADARRANCTEAEVSRWGRAEIPAVTDETGGLVVPLGEEKIDRVLEGARRRVVVLGGHEYERVEGTDFRGPGQRVRLRVLVERGRHRLAGRAAAGHRRPDARPRGGP